MNWAWGLALLLAVVFVGVGVRLSSWWRSLRHRERGQVAVEGEHAAERILAAHGYEVVGRQATARWNIEVDGVALAVTARADLIVTRRGRRYVAEVKTGTRAPDPTLPATRRQLLEYTFVFGVDRVLLVDVEAGDIHVVRFPDAMARRRGDDATT